MEEPWVCPGMDGQIAYKASDTEYNEYDQRLTEQFNHGLDNEVMIGGILGELTEFSLVWWTDKKTRELEA